MANEQKIFEVVSAPGIKRDGTELDSDGYSSGQWVRFQRGRPKKMGGYRMISDQITGPVRSVFIDSRTSVNSIHTFSPWGIQRLQVDNTGAGGAVYERTPASFVQNDLYTWSADLMYSSTGGAYAALIAASTPDIDNIASDVDGNVYSGDVTGTGAFTVVQDGSGDILVSGGCVVLQPFLFVYGSNGLIRNSNANDFSSATGWTTGGSNYANSANVCGTKVVKGLPMRGGTVSPAGLFWSLDSLIRVTLADATILWRYDTVSKSITVLSKNGIIEYDGMYFWAGVDRFFMYNGAVQELPNQMNLNWFFDNLNYEQRQKVFAMKVPRYGEIWWFYPRGSATECTDVVIYNVREGIWYDNSIERSAGFHSQVLSFPVMAGGEDSRETTYLTYTLNSGTFEIGDTVTGGTSGRTGTIVRSFDGMLNLTDLSGTTPFTNGETITSSSGGDGTLTADEQEQQLDVVWQHEFGTDKVYGDSVTAIQATIQTTNFSFATGGPVKGNVPVNRQTRVTRIEPDFIQEGDMNLYVVGRSFANDEDETSTAFQFSPETPYVDTREQRRICSLKFESNTVGGKFEMGKVIATIEAGDNRG